MMPVAYRLLHVDDDAEIRLIVALSLGVDPGMTVTGAASAAVAQALLDNAAVPLPDLLLLDYYIAGTDGIALLETIRARPRTARLPAIFLTGNLVAGERGRMMAAGALGVIAKPFNPMTLAREVRGLSGG